MGYKILSLASLHLARNYTSNGVYGVYGVYHGVYHWTFSFKHFYCPDVTSSTTHMKRA